MTQNMTSVPSRNGEGWLPGRSVDVGSTSPFNAPNCSSQGAITRSKLEALQNEIGALDILTSRIPWAKSLGSEICLSEKKDQGDEDAVAMHAQDLIELAKERIEKKTGYLRLLSLLTFFCIYSAATLLQREGTLATDVEARQYIDQYRDRGEVGAGDERARARRDGYLEGGSFVHTQSKSNKLCPRNSETESICI
jgi:hypothetical protein